VTAPDPPKWPRPLFVVLAVTASAGGLLASGVADARLFDALSNDAAGWLLVCLSAALLAGIAGLWRLR